MALSRRPRPSSENWPFNQSYFLGAGSSYFYNERSNWNIYPGDWARGQTGYSGSAGSGIKLADFSLPSEAFLMGDLTAIAYPFQPLGYALDAWAWHNKPLPVKANILFVDGHVAFIETRNAGSWPGFTWFGR